MSNIDLNKYKEFVQGVTSTASNETVELCNRLEALENQSNVNMATLLTGAVGMSSEAGEFAEIIKNQDNLVNLIRNFVEVEKNSENEFRSRVRNMDIQLAKIFNELTTGRQDNLSELREDFTILSNAILRLANSNNENKSE